MATTQIIRVAEKASEALTLSNTSKSTEGLTVGVYLVTLSGTATLIGSASGASAGTDVVISCDFGTDGITAGETYKLEVVADVAGDNPVTMLPNSNTADRIYIKIVPMGAIS